MYNARINLRLLGGFDARVATGGRVRLATRKATALLAVLGLRPGQAHRRERLAALLWGDMPDVQARTNLRSALMFLRRNLPDPGLFVVDGDLVAVDPALVSSDVDAVERAVAVGTIEELERVHQLDRGDFLDGFHLREAAFEEWLSAERERVRLIMHAALERLLAHRVQEGALDAATTVAQRLLVRDPSHEPAHRALMQAYAAQGRRAAAIRQFRTCETRLRQDLGLEPDVETRALHEAIRQAAEPVALPPLRGRRRTDGPAVARGPLIGRGDEWTRLHAALAAAWKGRGGVVTVVGEAGIGKTRLADETAHEARRRGWQVLVGRCFETDLRLPFGPWLDAVRAAGALTAADALEPAWRAELARLFPELGGEGGDGDRGDVRQLFEALAQLLRQLATRRPLLLVLEDLHWADESSVRFLALLGRRVAGWRMLIVATARVEELIDAPLLRDVLRGLEHDEAVTLRLPPLSHAAIAALVRTLAGHRVSGLAALTDTVWARSEGHPLLAVEVLRANQQAVLSATDASLTTPERVRALVAARLERLGQRERHLVAVAAVLGRDISVDLLGPLANLAEDDVAAGVDELVQRRIFRGTAGAVDFIHDYVRAAAYDLLTPARRRLLHRAVAATLEGLADHDPHGHLAEIGRHYREGEVWDKATTYLRQAGRLAVTRSAYRDAVRCFEQALAANARLPRDRPRIAEAVDLRLDLRNALAPLHETERGLELVREAQALAEELGDGLRLARATAAQAFHDWHQGRLRDAVAAGHRALRLAIQHGDLTLELEARLHLARVFQHLAEYRALLEVSDPVVAALTGPRVRENLEMPMLAVVQCSIYRAAAFFETGAISRAMETAETAVRVATEAKHEYSLMWSLVLTGMMHVHRGVPDLARAALEQALQLCVEGNYSYGLSVVSAALGRAHLMAGRLDEAMPLLRRGAELARTQGPVPWDRIHDVWLAEGELALGRLDVARQIATAAMERARPCHEVRALVEGGIVLGDVALAEGAVDEAQRCYENALDVAVKAGARLFEAWCRLKLGRVLLLSDVSRADVERRAAAALFDEFGIEAR